MVRSISLPRHLWYNFIMFFEYMGKENLTQEEIEAIKDQVEQDLDWNSWSTNEPQGSDN